MELKPWENWNPWLETQFFFIQASPHAPFGAREQAWYFIGSTVVVSEPGPREICKKVVKIMTVAAVDAPVVYLICNGKSVGNSHFRSSICMPDWEGINTPQRQGKTVPHFYFFFRFPVCVQSELLGIIFCWRCVIRDSNIVWTLLYSSRISGGECLVPDIVTLLLLYLWVLGHHCGSESFFPKIIGAIFFFRITFLGDGKLSTYFLDLFEGQQNIHELIFGSLWCSVLAMIIYCSWKQLLLLNSLNAGCVTYVIFCCF